MWHRDGYADCPQHTYAISELSRSDLKDSLLAVLSTNIESLRDGKGSCNGRGSPEPSDRYSTGRSWSYSMEPSAENATGA
ncbi:hypothetical protein DTO164E3_3598 [Paecilomyces variotii]|nr:hypothetical protein DTO164E3_3598 [Paecilomyces variotii]KAJ9356571.1 hypothetical protein DTO027B9_3425 [Paecilomyces variotii]